MAAEQSRGVVLITGALTGIGAALRASSGSARLPRLRRRQTSHRRRGASRQGFGPTLSRRPRRHGFGFRRRRPRVCLPRHQWARRSGQQRRHRRGRPDRASSARGNEEAAGGERDRPSRGDSDLLAAPPPRPRAHRQHRLDRGANGLTRSGAYGASKFAVGALTDALRLEVQPWGIEVALIEPGAVATPIWEKGRTSGAALRQGLSPEAEAVYADAIAAVERAAARSAREAIPAESIAHLVAHALIAPRPKTRYLIGKYTRIQSIMARLPDRLRDRLLTTVLRLPKPGTKL